MSRSQTALIAAVVLFTAAGAGAGRVTPGPAVTDANLAEHVRHLETPAQQLALANYYAAKAAAEGPRIDFYEQLLRAYQDLEGKSYEPLRVQARWLLKAARETRKHLELLDAAHRSRSIVE